MVIHNKWKTTILILLVIILTFYIICINSKHTRYIDEDKHQFTKEINNLITKSKVIMDNVISNKEECIAYKDIELLMIYHGDLKRNVFEFKKKSNFIDKSISDGFQKLSDKYNYEEEINLENTHIYYENLLKRIEDNAMLNNDDVQMINGIYNLYNEIRKDINQII